ncbi:MAG TPA: 50S ribosomal protein L22 [Desulfobacterales bacterium]|jgi:large subunit ribosomal protein L22|nr:50S ribosomal protein L22 [Deltaproteobacteria bacterium]HSO59595.1 50S ribosomal protein L22 [Desulfobacterales bacterium]
MQAKAVSRYVRVSSLKVLKVSSAVKGKPVGAALSILKFMPQKAAKTLEKALRSAVANADQKPDVDVDRLVVRNITADEGPVLKRWGTKARGRGTRILKPTCHITVVLSEKSSV